MLRPLTRTEHLPITDARIVVGEMGLPSLHFKLGGKPCRLSIGIKRTVVEHGIVYVENPAFETDPGELKMSGRGSVRDRRVLALWEYLRRMLDRETATVEGPVPARVYTDDL